MVPPIFPTFKGQGWSVHKKPTFSTVVASHVSGREVRDALYANPIWQFELVIDGMDSSSSSYPGLGANSLQSLMGLFLQCQGQYGTFLYSDPSDYQVTAGGVINPGYPSNGQAAIDYGDGTTTVFTFARSMGNFLEPIGWANTVSNVYLNGVNQASGWSVGVPPTNNANSLVFGSPPGSGVAVTATLTYYFQCRFDADDLDFENFMSSLWKADTVKFRSVRTS